MPSAKPHPDARRALFDVLGPVVCDAGYDLEDLSIATVGRRRVLRLIIDSDERPDLDGIATVSRLVSDALDADPDAELLGEDYQLEVSSPGVDRPLIELRHWTRAIGRLVTVAVDGKQVTGRILSVRADGVELEVDARTSVASWAAVGPGKVRVEFNRATPADTRAQRPPLAIIEGG